MPAKGKSAKSKPEAEEQVVYVGNFDGVPPEVTPEVAEHLKLHHPHYDAVKPVVEQRLAAHLDAVALTAPANKSVLDERAKKAKEAPVEADAEPEEIAPGEVDPNSAWGRYEARMARKLAPFTVKEKDTEKAAPETLSPVTGTPQLVTPQSQQPVVTEVQATESKEDGTKSSASETSEGGK